MARQASVALALALLIVCAFSKPTDDGDVSPAHYFPSDIRERVTAGTRFHDRAVEASTDAGACLESSKVLNVILMFFSLGLRMFCVSGGCRASSGLVVVFSLVLVIDCWF